jgi:hypothetical protein
VKTRFQAFVCIFQIVPLQRGEFPGGVRRWTLALLEALTPPLLQRARLRAQRIATRREREEEEEERMRPGRGHRLGGGSETTATATADTRDGGGGDRATEEEDDSEGEGIGDTGAVAGEIEGGGSEGPGSHRRRRRRSSSSRCRPSWDVARLRAVFSRGVAHAARALDDATLAAFATSSGPDVPEPTDPTHGFLPRLHLAAFYLWVSTHPGGGLLQRTFFYYNPSNRGEPESWWGEGGGEGDWIHQAPRGTYTERVRVHTIVYTPSFAVARDFNIEL